MSTDKLFVCSLIGAFRTLWRLEWNDSISGYKRSYRKEELVNMPLRYALVVKVLLKDPVPDTLITAGAQKSQLHVCSERIRFYMTFW